MFHSKGDQVFEISLKIWVGHFQRRKNNTIFKQYCFEMYHKTYYSMLLYLGCYCIYILVTERTQTLSSRHECSVLYVTCIKHVPTP